MFSACKKKEMTLDDLKKREPKCEGLDGLSYYHGGGMEGSTHHIELKTEKDGRITLTYQDLDAAKAYFEDYGKKLEEMGYIYTYAPGDNAKEYRSANDFVLFRWSLYEDDEMIRLEFKNEKSLAVEEVRSLMKEHGLPEVDIHGEIGARDLTRYFYNTIEFEGIFLTVYQPFESPEEAEAFLDELVADLDEQDYLYTNPRNLGSNRSFLYWNEDIRKYVAFDYYKSGTGATVFFEFVSIESQLEGLLETVLRR